MGKLLRSLFQSSDVRSPMLISERRAASSFSDHLAGIARDSMHKRRPTGGKKKAWRKKRKTQTLVKSAIVQVHAASFKQWYLQHCGVDIGKKKDASKKESTEEGETPSEEAKQSNHILRMIEKRQKDRKLGPRIQE
ncbi:hypothetical protein SAY86_015848 [Trapa natans]|uniref:Uncharacterized protein n=1 Tax=Trapa natans TaxID=22666 RepID=A0AAN7LJ90_TRANT|nr:hypothetical protein SAY86_015848 [Trapa natans]